MSLQAAVAKESGSAVAWTELGATQRMRGEFKDAAASYEQAIAADASYAPAWRNLGVVADLYLGDPNRALAAFEQYKELTGRRQAGERVDCGAAGSASGMPAPKRPAGAPGRRGGRAAGGGATPGAPPPPPPQPAPGAAPANAAAAAPGRSQEDDHAQHVLLQGRAPPASRCSSACSAAAVRSRSRVRRRRRRTRHRGLSSSSRAWTRHRARRRRRPLPPKQRAPPARPAARPSAPPARGARARQPLAASPRAGRTGLQKRRGRLRRLPAKRERTVWNWIRQPSKVTASCRR